MQTTPYTISATVSTTATYGLDPPPQQPSTSSSPFAWEREQGYGIDTQQQQSQYNTQFQYWNTGPPSYDDAVKTSGNNNAGGRF